MCMWSMALTVNMFRQPWFQFTASANFHPSQSRQQLSQQIPRGGGLEHVNTLAEHISNLQIEIQSFDPAPLAEYDQTKRHQWSAASMIPLFIPWLIDGKCILLDADTVSLCDISELYSTDMKGYPIGACLAPSVSWRVRKYMSFGLTLILPHKVKSKRQQITKWAASIGFTIEELQSKYFAAGVYIMDNPAIRAFDPHRTLSDVEKSRPHWGHMPDMDRFNEFFKDQVFFLDLKWNVYRDSVFLNRYYSSPEMWKQFTNAAKNPAIYHYPSLYTRKVWKRPWYRARKRHHIYRQLCQEIQDHMGIGIIEMLEQA